MDFIREASFITAWIVVCAVVLLRATAIIGAAFAFIEWTGFAKRRKVYALGYEKGQLINELRAALLVVLVDATIVVLLIRSGMMNRAADPGFLTGIATFAFMFVWLEIWFYATHRTIHHPRLWWIHRQHHTAKVTNPLTSLSFSVVERAMLFIGLLGVTVVFSHLIMPVSLGGLLTFTAFTYVMNVIGHSNVEVVPAWFTRATRGIIYTPSYHSMHHARFKGHYGLYTTVLDKMFGTYFEDYPGVYERARTGEGLEALNERVLGGG